MKERLEYVLGALLSLKDNYFIRSEGDMKFNEAKNELESIINNFDDVQAVAVVAEVEKVQSDFEKSVNEDMETLKNGFSDVMVHLLEISEKLNTPAPAPAAQEAPAQAAA